MIPERAARLARFCRDRAGDHLRVVVGYDAEEYVVAYAIDEARERYTSDEVDRLVGAFRATHGELWGPAMSDLPLGSADAAVHHHGDVLVVHLMADAECGYLASFDQAAGSALTDFVDECRLRVAGEMAD
ncbi:MAG: hypothetical protein ABEH78_01470 [Haloferacaceae archaeon]